jgi:hypothetical protein
MKAKKDYFENEKSIVTVYGGRCGSVNIPMLKAFTFERRWCEKISYVVITRKGILGYYGNALFAFDGGDKNVHYKEFAAKRPPITL